MAKRDLYYFTTSYPYGIAENWKHEELEACIDEFRRVVVVPLTDGGDQSNWRAVPRGVEVVEPLLSGSPSLKSPRHILRTVTSPRVPMFLRELYRGNAYRRTLFLRSWTRSSLQIESLVRHETIREIASSDATGLVLYFFWGRGTAELAPWFRQHCPHARLVTRFHRFDLYEDRSGGYIPYQRAVVDAIDAALIVSAHGLDHLRQRYPQHAHKMRLQRLGSTARGEAHPSTDGVTRIVSCSSVRPVKRVPLIAEALKSVDVPVRWTHIGSGPELPKVLEIVKTLPDHVQAHIVGTVAAEEVMSFYVDQPVDLFINVSTSEGVPVSIMEALSAGIPVVATSVGGTPELVDRDVGELLSSDVTPNELATTIERYADLCDPARQQLRVRARQRHRERSDAKTLTGDLIRTLRGQAV